MYIRTVKQKIDFCSDQCCYSSHCSFGVKGDFLYECLIYVNINDKWGLSGRIFPRERGGPVCVISSDPIFTLFTVERLKNTVFLAALFLFLSFFFIIRKANPRCVEHWASVLSFQNDCDGGAERCCPVLFCSHIYLDDW